MAGHMPVSQQVLIVISSIYVVTVFGYFMWTLYVLQSIPIQSCSNTQLVKRNMFCFIPVLLYLLNQAANISLIVHFYEINNAEFFWMSLVSFIIYRFVTSVSMSVINNRFPSYRNCYYDDGIDPRDFDDYPLQWCNFQRLRSFCLYFLLDWNMVRSQLLYYIWGSNLHQKRLIFYQIICITFLQFIYCLILVLSSSHSFIVWYSIILSLFILLTNTTLDTTNSSFICMMLHTTDSLGKIIMCALLYVAPIILIRVVILYFTYFFKMIMLFLVLYAYNENVYFLIDIFDRNDAFYLMEQQVVDDDGECKYIRKALFVLKLSVMVLITSFISYSNSSTVIIMTVICWILNIVIPVISWIINAKYHIFDETDSWRHAYKDSWKYGLEDKYYSRQCKLRHLFIDLSISECVKQDEKTDKTRYKLLLIGDENNASCRILKQLNSINNILRFQSRSILIYGYIQQFQIENMVNIYIPDGVIGCIARYFSYDILLRCCYPLIVTNRYNFHNYNSVNVTVESHEIELNHIHTEGIFGGRLKLFELFTNSDAIIYCVSLAMYNVMDPEDTYTNMMQKSINKFRILLNHKFFGSNAFFVVLFMDYKQFEDQISNGISLKICFCDYKGNQNSVDESFEFIKNKYHIYNPNIVYLNHTRIHVYDYVMKTNDINELENLHEAWIHRLIRERGE